MNAAQVEKKLAAQGHRATASRREVINALLAFSSHMTADDLYAAIR